MRGHVRKRGKTWTSYWFVVDPDGKRVQKSKGGFRTKQLANEHLTAQLGSIQRGEYVEPTKLTVGEFLQAKWLPAIAATIRPTTLVSYRMHVEKYVVPRIGGVQLQTVSGDTLNKLYAELLEGGRIKREGGLSPASVRRIHATVHRAFRDALRWNRVVRNPADAADPPRARATRPSEHQVWNAAELKCFLAAVESDRLYPAFAVAATTGLRRGELLGSRWADLDFETARLAVRQTLITVQNKMVFSTPKTTRGRRNIPLDQHTLAILRAHRARQAEERLAWGPGYQDHDLIFAWESGAPINPNTLSQKFDRLVGRLGLPRIPFHGLRHGYASMSLSVGVPTKVVSDRMGHATSAFTQDQYMHAIPSLQEDAAEKVAALIFSAP